MVKSIIIIISVIWGKGHMQEKIPKYTLLDEDITFFYDLSDTNAFYGHFFLNKRGVNQI